MINSSLWLFKIRRYQNVPKYHPYSNKNITEIWNLLTNLTSLSTSQHRGGWLANFLRFYQNAATCGCGCKGEISDRKLLILSASMWVHLLSTCHSTKTFNSMLGMRRDFNPFFEKREQGLPWILTCMKMNSCCWSAIYGN